MLAAHWADLHPGESLGDARRRGGGGGGGGGGRRGAERAVRVGADGTPLVGEFAAMELGALQGMGHVAARCLIRDALNVRHRHPQLWAAVGAGTARVWLARKVAQMCTAAGLGEDQAHRVDAQTTGYASSLPWARFVRTGQSCEYGLKTLVARATAGEVIFFVAMVDRIATILAEDGDTDPVAVRRSKATGILATPERALRLLHTAARARS